ncbi:MGMT family protein [candidate division WOR-3 bacterium]|nr:MGMT family protein [candidate division WOR-3 bacterium]
MEDFTGAVIETVKLIPRGKVMTYGQIASFVGSPRSSRQVSRILHSCSEKFSLPWHRIVNSKGEIAFKRNQAYSEQKTLLEGEGIVFDKEGRIDLDKFLFKPFNGNS